MNRNRKHALDSVQLASDKYLKAKLELENRREILANACHRASRAGATHEEMAERTPYTRQRISQFLSDGALHREKV